MHKDTTQHIITLTDRKYPLRVITEIFTGIMWVLDSDLFSMHYRPGYEPGLIYWLIAKQTDIFLACDVSERK